MVQLYTDDQSNAMATAAAAPLSSHRRDAPPDPVTAAPASPGSGVYSIGRAISSTLMRAVYEKRVVVGVAAAVKELLSNATAGADATAAAGDVMFCVLAPVPAGDSAKHMQQVLLEAFCYENGVYTVKVDSAQKLSRLLGVQRGQAAQTCALIRRAWMDDGGGGESMQADKYDETLLSLAENVMVDHCEEHWDTQTPTVHLPD